MSRLAPTLALLTLAALLSPLAAGALFRDHATAVTSSGSGESSLAIPKPATLATGDLMIAFVLVNPSTATVTPPAGWTSLASATATSGSLGQSVYHRWATASEAATYTFTFGAAAKSVGAIVAYRGVHASTTFGSTATSASTTATITAPAATTTVDGEVLVASFAVQRTTTITDPGPTTAGFPAMTARSPATGTLTSGGGGGPTTHVSLRIADATATTVGAQSTYTATMANAAANLGTVIALKPTPDLTVDPDPVGANGVAQTGASWGGWTADPAATNVAALNYFRITNTGLTPTQPFVLSFSASDFTGASDPTETVPIAGNIQFAWAEDKTPSTSSPSELTFTFGSTSVDGSVAGAFTGLGNIIYVTYRLVSIPDPTVDQAYQASFTVTEA